MNLCCCISFRVIVTASIVAFAGPTLAADIIGQARVIDGDTIDIRGVRIRLHGIDAPEAKQTCLADGKRWRCGQQATLVLADRIGHQPVQCEERDRDRYKRVVAVCRVQGHDINAWLVSEGWALAYRQYSTDYVPQEVQAATGNKGLWRGEFVKPWKWRRGTRLEAGR